MSPLHIVKCTENDLDALTEMFGHLVLDEQSDRVWTEEQRRGALLEFMRSGSSAYFFQDGDLIVGYALVNEKHSRLYLQHFFICRDQRRKHYGQEAFHVLMEELGADTIDLDVYIWNSPGLAFWRSLGFSERSIMMRYHAKKPETKPDN